MARKLDDAAAEDIRNRAAAGTPYRIISRDTGVTIGQISKIANEEQHQKLAVVDFGDGNAARTVRTTELELTRLELDPDVDPEAAAVLALAEKIDACRAATSAQSAIAAGPLVKLHGELLDDLRDRTGHGEMPRIGRLRGRQAHMILLGLGYTDAVVDCDVSQIDLPHGFDGVEAIRLKGARRKLGLEYGPHQAAVDYAIRHREDV